MHPIPMHQRCNHSPSLQYTFAPKVHRVKKMHCKGAKVFSTCNLRCKYQVERHSTPFYSCGGADSMPLSDSPKEGLIQSVCTPFTPWNAPGAPVRHLASLTYGLHCSFFFPVHLLTISFPCTPIPLWYTKGLCTYTFTPKVSETVWGVLHLLSCVTFPMLESRLVKRSKP